MGFVHPQLKLTLDFIGPIKVTGSPFKGVDDAPVAIAVFGDFE